MRFNHRRVKLTEAQAFYKTHHMHSDPLNRHMFSIGVGERENREDTPSLVPNWTFQRLEDLVAIASVGQPSRPRFNKAYVAEVKRVCSRYRAPKNAVSY